MSDRKNSGDWNFQLLGYFLAHFVNNFDGGTLPPTMDLEAQPDDIEEDYGYSLFSARRTPTVAFAADKASSRPSSALALTSISIDHFCSDPITKNKLGHTLPLPLPQQVAQSPSDLSARGRTYWLGFAGEPQTADSRSQRWLFFLSISNNAISECQSKR